MTAFLWNWRVRCPWCRTLDVFKGMDMKKMHNAVWGRISRFAFVLPMAVLTACAANGNLPAAPASVEAPNLAYKIAALDTLSVIVWRNPELSTVVTVRPDGFVSIPLVEDLQAAGKNPADLSREIETALAKLIREPVVSIVVTGFQGGYSDQVRIAGETQRPQAVPYRQNMTVLDLLIQAGGMTDGADGNGAVLIRESEGGKQYRLRLKDLMRGGDISANAAMKPGDIILVPRSLF